MTTERVLPGIALPVPAPRVREAARAHPVATRREPWMTAPARAGMLLGASGAVYAISLAAVAGMQSSADLEVAARREPYVQAVEAARAANDDLEAALRRADAAARGLGAAYARTTEQIAAHEARLDELAALVAEVEGSAASLPSRISLPSVSVRGAVAPARAPRTTATSRGSGG